MAVLAHLGVQRMALCVFIFSAHLFDVQLLGRIFSFLFCVCPQVTIVASGYFLCQKGRKELRMATTTKLRSAEYYRNGKRLRVRYHRSATQIEALVTLGTVKAPNDWLPAVETSAVCSVAEAATIRSAFLSGRPIRLPMRKEVLV